MVLVLVAVMEEVVLAPAMQGPAQVREAVLVLGLAVPAAARGVVSGPAQAQERAHFRALRSRVAAAQGGRVERVHRGHGVHRANTVTA